MGKDNTHNGKNKYRQRPKPYQKDNHRRFNAPQRQHKPRPAHAFVPKVSLTENQVGITEFVSDSAGFTGIIKSRFSDFHVNEIDTNGKVLQLTDLNILKPEEPTLSEEEVTAAREQLTNVVSSQQWEEMKALHASKTTDAAVVEIDVSDLDKETRTKIHKVLKHLFAGKLVSTTVNKEGTDKKYIHVKKPIAGKDRNRNQWTFDGKYVYFLVHKENMDTSEVVVAMASRLNLRPSQINYCGIKDKRAKTTQKFCIKHRLPGQIVGSIKSLPTVHVGNFEFGNEVLKLGDLMGNRFRIALRHITGEQKDIEVAVQNLRTNGFINYYGLQRFGNCAAIPTYDIGVALLKSDYKLACELILKPRDNDIPFMRTIRETWWKDRNSAAAAAMFRSDKSLEKKILDGLAQYGENDYSTALRKIPRNMLLFYPHSFQSLIFNRILSRRINKLGLKLIVGDLVYRDKNELDAFDEATECMETDVAAEDNDGTDNKTTEEVTTTEESVFKRKVKALTSEDISSGAYTLFDVVLPLPGYDITYPANEVAQWYDELLQEYGLTSEMLHHNVKTYALTGAYRRMLLQPLEMSWEFRNYDTPECTLIASDWELLKGKTLPDPPSEGKYKALILNFSLPTAAYATMLLRELLKSDTSAKHQINLEQQARHSTPSDDADNKVNDAETITAEKRKLDDDDDGSAEQALTEDAASACKLQKTSATATENAIQ